MRVLQKMEVILNDLLVAAGVYEITGLRLEHVGECHIFTEAFLQALYPLRIFRYAKPNSLKLLE